KVTLVKGSLLRFTAKNWNLPQTIRVRGNQDANSADQNATLSVQAAGYRTSDISVLVRDDDPSRPRLITPLKTQAVVGLPYQVDFDATGVPAPTFSLFDAPEGMTIDPSTGLVTWTPTQTGGCAVHVRAENDQGTDGVGFSVTVNSDQPPIAFILQPLDGSTISGSNAEFYGGSTDDSATYKGEFYID